MYFALTMYVCVYVYIRYMFMYVIKMKSHSIGFAKEEFSVTTNIYNSANIFKIKFKWFTS